MQVREDRSSGSRDMLADRNTHRQSDKLIAIPRSPTWRSNDTAAHYAIIRCPR